MFADAMLEGLLRTTPGVEAASLATHGYHLTPALMNDGEPIPTRDELARKAPILTTPRRRRSSR